MPHFTDSGPNVTRELGVELPDLWCKSINATGVAKRFAEDVLAVQR